MRKIELLFLLLINFLIILSARPEQPVIDAVRIVSGYKEQVPGIEPKHPVKGEKIILYLLLCSQWQGSAKYFGLPESADLGKEGIVEVNPWLKDYGPLEITWYKVEPSKSSLSNTEGGWHWEPVEYLESFYQKEGFTAEADVNPKFHRINKGLGTMRYSASVIHLQKYTVSSKGAKDRIRGGISPEVHRVSFRNNTGYPIVDWGCSFMNQPYIWGSESPTGLDCDHQAEQYFGADCADFVVAAARKAGHRLSYTGTYRFFPGNQAAITVYVEKKPRLLEDGTYCSDKGVIRIGEGEQVKIGDIILYERHVGILAEDTAPVGIFDKNDLILHTLFHEPEFSPVSSAYPGPFCIVRFIH